MASDEQALLLQLGLQLSKLQKDWDKAVGIADAGSGRMERRAKTAGDSIEKALGKADVAKALDKVFDRSKLAVFETGAAKIPVFGSAIETLGPAGIIAAAGLGAFALVMEGASKATEFAANLEVTAKALGVGTTFLQKFNFAAAQSDVPIRTADEALKSLNANLGLVQAGLARKMLTNAFAAVGFTPDQLRQFHDAGELFPVLADRIAKMTNAAEQAAIAKRLGIAELLPMLKDGSESFASLSAQAEKLGIIMDAGLVQSAAEAHRRLVGIDEVMKDRANISFAKFADTLIAVKSGFQAAEAAGLSFLAKVTNTQPIQDKITDKMTEIRALMGKRDFSQNAVAQHLVQQAYASLAALNKAALAQHALEASADGDGKPKTAAPVLYTAPAHADHKVENATKTLDKGLTGLQDQADKGLEDLELPKATADADAMRQKLDELVKAAQEAGVNTSAFAARIATLRDGIDKVEFAGLAKEAQAFGIEVAKDERDVDSFAKGGLSPLQAALQAVDDTYKGHRAQIDEHIRANTVLAEKNTAAAASMVVLRGQLAALEIAHAKATASATAQFEAEERIANLKNAAEVNSAADAIQVFQTLRGDFGALTDSQQKMLEIEKQLRDTRLEAETKLAELTAERDAAAARGDVDEVARKNVLITLQAKLAGLAEATTAQQIAAQQKLAEVLAAVRSAMVSSVSDLLAAAEKGFKGFDFKSWAQQLAASVQKALNDSLAQTLVDNLMSWLGIGKKQTVGTMYVGSLITGGAAAGKAGGIMGLFQKIFGGGQTFAPSSGYTSIPDLGGDGGFTSDVSSFIPDLPGFAGGGSFQVGGSGGIDSQMVAFRASPDESVHVTKGSQGMGGTHVSVPISIDARGATPDAVAMLQRKLDELNANLPGIIVSRVNDARGRGFIR